MRLSDAGGATKIDLAAKVGDITAKVEGTLRTLGLPGSDLRFRSFARGSRAPPACSA